MNKSPPKHTANHVWLTSFATPMKEYLDLLMQARQSLVVMRFQAISDLWSLLSPWFPCAAGMYHWFRCLSLLFSVSPSSVSGSFRQGHIVRDFSSHLALSMNWPINVKGYWLFLGLPSHLTPPQVNMLTFVGRRRVSVCICIAWFCTCL